MRCHRMVHRNYGILMGCLQKKRACPHGTYLSFHVSDLRGSLSAAPPVFAPFRSTLVFPRPDLYALHFYRRIRKRQISAEKELLPVGLPEKRVEYQPGDPAGFCSGVVWAGAAV